jgi:hypothetical protein
MLTVRSPRVLLGQRDLHAILVVVIIDLSLTIQGILHHGGSEANPFFRQLTEIGLEAMVAGVVFYIAVLCVLSLLLTGDTRKILASIAFGMHVVGVMTWFYVIDSYLGTALADQTNIFYYTLAGTAATALFYYFEDCADTRHNGED